MRKPGSHRPVAQWTASDHQGSVTSAFCPHLRPCPGLHHYGNLSLSLIGLQVSPSLSRWFHMQSQDTTLFALHHGKFCGGRYL